MAPCCGNTEPAAQSAEASGLQVDGRAPGNPRIKHAIFVGNSGVGKTMLLLRLKTRDEPMPQNSTIGVDFWQDKAKTSPVDVSTILFWDTAGQDRFKSIVTSYYRRACLVIAVFSLIDQASYDALQEWIDSVFDNASSTHHKVVLMVIGTQRDRIGPEHPRVKVSDIAEKVGREIDYYAEVSSITGKGIKTLWNALGEYSSSGDIVKTRTRRMDILGIKPHLMPAKTKPKRKGDAPEDCPVENPIPVACE
jgi:small GTP-binding protein